MRTRPRRPRATHLASVAALVAVALTLAPGTAAAHGVGASRFDAPLPLGVLLGGAGATVAATAALVALGDRQARPGDTLDRQPTRHLWAFSARTVRAGRVALGAIFLVIVAAVLLVGVGGRQVAGENLATVVTWPLWFHGIALVAILVGNPWPALAPWRTVYRGLVRLEGREFALLDGVPAWLGWWPATVGFVAVFGVVENLTVVPRSPRLTAGLVAVLTVAMILGGVVAGPAWFRRADPLWVLYRLFGRVSPFMTRATDTGYRVRLRPPWRGCENPIGHDSLVIFAVAMVYTVSFDGASDLRAFQSVLFAVRERLGTGAGTSLLLYAVGLVAFVVLFGIAIWLVERLGAGRGERWRTAARRFAPTLLPIAAAYEVAHVYPFVFENLGQLPTVVLAPLGIHAGRVELLAWLSLPAFWASQVLLIVLGHVVAVIAAHRVARDRFGSPRAARWGHLPLVVLMVGYTVLSLWIVSAPVLG